MTMTVKKFTPMYEFLWADYIVPPASTRRILAARLRGGGNEEVEATET